MNRTFTITAKATDGRQRPDTSTNTDSDEVRYRRTAAIVDRVHSELMQAMEEIRAYEYTSAVLRSRGVPMLDKFTDMAIKAFRRGLGLPEGLVNPDTRAFLKFKVLLCKGIKATFWTIEPVMPTCQIGPANAGDLATVRAIGDKITVRDPMGMSSFNTDLKSDKLVGRIVPYAAHVMGFEEGDMTMCTLGASSFHLTLHKDGTVMHHLAMTTSTMRLIERFFPPTLSLDSGTTIAMNVGLADKIEFTVSSKRNRSSKFKIFSHGGFQFAGSPKDIETLTRDVAETILQTFCMSPIEFVASMRVVERFEVRKTLAP